MVDAGVVSRYLTVVVGVGVGSVRVCGGGSIGGSGVGGGSGVCVVASGVSVSRDGGSVGGGSGITSISGIGDGTGVGGIGGGDVHLFGSLKVLLGGGGEGNSGQGKDSKLQNYRNFHYYSVTTHFNSNYL